MFRTRRRIRRGDVREGMQCEHDVAFQGRSGVCRYWFGAYKVRVQTGGVADSRRGISARLRQGWASAEDPTPQGICVKGAVAQRYCGTRAQEPVRHGWSYQRIRFLDSDHGETVWIEPWPFPDARLPAWSGSLCCGK